MGLCIGILFFLVLGALDDWMNLPSSVRLLLELGFLFGLFYWISPAWTFFGLSLQNWPLASAFALALYAAFFTNLCNFMDGLDTYLTIVFIYGVFFSLLLFESTAASPLIYVLLGSALGYLVWNLPPARLFMGDSGSLPIGFAMSYLPFLLAPSDVSIPMETLALLFPVFWYDGILTILVRLANRENILQAHRKHLYQIFAWNEGRKRLSPILFLALNLGGVATFFALEEWRDLSVFIWISFFALYILGALVWRYRIEHSIPVIEITNVSSGRNHSRENG